MPTVLFPINQDEQAVQARADYLLAQDVFEKIAGLLERGLAKVCSLKNLDDLDQHRAHEAILLQGPRGSGKSAVLVNLALYLKERKEKLERELLILKPIDPTLLEDGKNMFLDVFIAALVRDKHIKAKLDQGGREADAFYDQLGKVGSALESSQTQEEQHGMDRVRALIGGNGIAEQVHKLFQSALNLTCKKLIVLPIDDVDTALQHAYEKIEIVRKYLVSPYVIPIISGDLALYNDLIWRDFHGRLLTDSDAEKDEAMERAKRLSIDYQRKILPLPRRIDVPILATYLNDPEVILVDKDSKLISFPVFKGWLDAVLNERVNGVENSYLSLPINTVREFAQLVSHVQLPLHKLGKIWDEKTSFSLLEIRRLSFMKPQVAHIISDFAKEFSIARTLTSEPVRNAAFTKAYSAVNSQLSTLQKDQATNLGEVFVNWQEELKAYFVHHQSGGAVYITMEANSYFRRCAKAQGDEVKSVFDTILFKPQRHQQYKEFTQSKDIHDQWENYLKPHIPKGWLKNIPKLSILDYVNPEHGYLVTVPEKKLIEKVFGLILGNKNSEDSEDSEDSEESEESEDLMGAELSEFSENPWKLGNSEDVVLIYRLMTYFNYHNSNSRGTLVVTGRVFELLITSLIREISVKELYDLIYRLPFYSSAERVGDGIFEFAIDRTILRGEVDDYHLSKSLSKLVDEINNWHNKHKGTLIFPPHAWMIYNVMNKFFMNANRFNPVRRSPPEYFIDNIFGVAVKAFNAIWNTFANFEKGPIFGLDLMLADFAIPGGGKDFSKRRLYKKNILPLLRFVDQNQIDKEGGGISSTGSYTLALASHPLKTLFERTYEFMVSGENSASDLISEMSSNIQSKNKLNSRKETVEISDDDWYAFNDVLKIILRKSQKSWSVGEIMKAKLSDLYDVAELVRIELSKDGGVWLPYLDNILLYQTFNGSSSFGRIQRIFQRIEALRKPT